MGSNFNKCHSSFSKFTATAVIIVLISEIAKVNERMGSLVAAMPHSILNFILDEL